MAKPQQIYLIRVADRNTGDESELRVTAPNQQAAMSDAMLQGWLVVSARRDEADGETGEQRRDPGVEVALSAEDRRTGARSMLAIRLGLALTAAGIAVFVIAFNLDTTNGDVHNIGLLNEQLILAIGGAAVGAAGLIIAGTGLIADAVIRSLTTGPNATG